MNNGLDLIPMLITWPFTLTARPLFSTRRAAMKSWSLLHEGIGMVKEPYADVDMGRSATVAKPAKAYFALFAIDSNHDT